MWKLHSTSFLGLLTHSGIETEPDPGHGHDHPRTAPESVALPPRHFDPRHDELAVLGLLDDEAMVRPRSLRTLAGTPDRATLATLGLLSAGDSGRTLASASPRELLGMLGLGG